MPVHMFSPRFCSEIGATPQKELADDAQISCERSPYPRDFHIRTQFLIDPPSSRTSAGEGMVSAELLVQSRPALTNSDRSRITRHSSFESDATKKLYGLDDEVTSAFGTNCLLARRLVERGVRFVELYCGSGSGLDAHNELERNYSKWCRVSDKPVAGLLSDLKARGMLNDTLACGAANLDALRSARARGAITIRGDSRSGWRAAALVKGGQYIGTTDELGMRAVDQPVNVHDIHASILHTLGLNHVNLTHMHNGRAERPTIVAGELIKNLFG